ncbi:RNA ligase family protein [Anaerovoracaceae bacterium 41-7]
MRKLAHVERIADIKSIPNADKIEVATVLGWQVVIKKGEFSPGEQVVYIEIDSRVPSDNPYFSFLQDRNYKVKSIKLRKQVSQGLIVPMNLLPTGKYADGDDVTELLKIIKIEDEYKAPKISKETQLKQRHKKLYNNKIFKRLMRLEWFRKIVFKLLIPKKKKTGWLPWVIKTDEERVQNMPWILQDKELFTVTEKLDGTSATYTLHKEGRKWKFYVCSRNVVQDTPERKNYFVNLGNVYWEMEEKYHIKDALKWLAEEFNAAEYVTLQGEIIGDGIQKNKYEIDGHDLYLFNLIVDDVKLPSIQSAELIKKVGMKWVPIITDEYILPDTVDELMDYSTGKATLKPDTLREGYVFRNYEKGISFKCVSNEFLLKWKL